MVVEFDDAKNTRNVSKHGIALYRAEEMDFSAALVRHDDRENYGEVRYQAIGFVGPTLHVLIFTVRENLVRAISLRKATRTETREYAEQF